jgi:hypothetical protein
MAQVPRQAVRKTPLMRGVEKKYSEDLEVLLPQMYNEMGLPKMSQKLGIHKATIWYWFLKFGVSIKKHASIPAYEQKEVGDNE